MADSIRLGVRLDADGKGFVGAVTVSGQALDRFGGRARRASAETRRLARTTGQAAEAARGAGQSFLAAHGRMGAYLTSAVGFHQFARLLGAVRDASVRQERALAQVEARIRSTGGSPAHAGIDRAPGRSTSSRTGRPPGSSSPTASCPP